MVVESCQEEEDCGLANPKIMKVMAKVLIIKIKSLPFSFQLLVFIELREDILNVENCLLL
jgi:hypothetical protein